MNFEELEIEKELDRKDLSNEKRQSLDKKSLPRRFVQIHLATVIHPSISFSSCGGKHWKHE